MVDINIKKTVYNKDDDDGLLISSSAIPHHKSNRSGWEGKGNVKEAELWLNSTQRWYGELCRSNAGAQPESIAHKMQCFKVFIGEKAHITSGAFWLL